MTNFNRARYVCHEGSQLPGTDDSAAKFTQEDLNKILAEDRRKHQAQVTKIQQTLEETLTSKNLSVQEREQLANKLAEVEAQGRTKEQQLAHERKTEAEKHSKELAARTEEAKTWRDRFNTELIDRSLTEAAASEEVFSVNQVTQLLRNGVSLDQVRDEATGQLTDKFVPMVTFEDRDEAGNPIQSKAAPKAAMKRMKQLTSVYGNLFKSGVVSGIGSGSGAGAATEKGIDVTKLTPQQYAEIRAKNPELLGLRRNKRTRM